MNRDPVSWDVDNGGQPYLPHVFQSTGASPLFLGSDIMGNWPEYLTEGPPIDLLDSFDATAFLYEVSRFPSLLHFETGNTSEVDRSVAGLAGIDNSISSIPNMPSESSGHSKTIFRAVVGSPAAAEASMKRRKPRNGPYHLFCCHRCTKTFTKKHNLNCT